MKIKESAVGMYAERQYQKKTGVYKSATMTNASSGVKRKYVNYDSAEISENSYHYIGKNVGTETKQASETKKEENSGVIYNPGMVMNNGNSFIGTLANLEATTFKNLLDRILEILNKSSYRSEVSVSGFMENRTQNLFMGSLAVFQGGTARGGENSRIWQNDVKVSTCLSEQESTSVSAAGVVKTADGRSIDFSVDMNMSRSFMQQADIKYTEKITLTDPLVINMDRMPAGVTDMNFHFDIDGDGQVDKISSLREGSGFLALDKNGDGVINDGSELFGAASGDGFADLAAYDEDGNGWIDENDAVYDKLRVWTKDSGGNDVLFSLKEADIGAIYLSRTDSRFSLTDEENSVHAVVRSTGIYLKESTGEVGTVQQVDFAKKN